MKNRKLQKEYDEFLTEQIKILHKHFERCLLRCLNKLNEMKDETKINL